MGWTFVVRSSELEAFRRCRRAWDFGAAPRQRYAPQVPPPFAFDKAMYDALATYYFPAMDDWSRSIVRPLALKAFERSMGESRARHDLVRPLDEEVGCESSVRASGRDVTEEVGCESSVRASGRDVTEEVGCESSVRASGRDVTESDFAAHLDLGAAMLSNWFAWAAETEDFDSIFADHDVWSPIADPDSPGSDLGTPDGRPIRYLGRIDQLIGDPNDEFWVVRHRLVQDDWTDNASLIDDLRILGECWALQVAYSQLVIAGTITNELRIEGQLEAEPPTVYRELDNRDMSGPRHTNVLRSPTPPPLAWAAASMTELDHISDQADNGLFRRTVVRRSPESMRRIGEQIAAEVKEMQRDDVTVAPTFGTQCATCAFRRPCEAMEAGTDARTVLDAAYEQVDDDVEQQSFPGGQSKTVNFRWG